MDGAPACPFVAFGDDRDGRSMSPDHRHRCFAESPPAPRALAHQEAYCLSSAFPVCPVFQDWARREAAHARGGGERPETAPTAVPYAADDPMPEDPGSPEPAAAGDAEQPVRRNPPRDWAAPPPWATGAAAGAASRAGTSGPPPDVASEFLAARSVQGQGLAGSPADRLAGGPPPPSTGSQGEDPSPATSAAAGAGAIAGAAAASGAGAGGASGAGDAASAGWSASSAGSSATPPHDDLAGLVQPRAAAVGAAAAASTKPAADGYPPSTLTGRRPTVSSTRPAGDAIPGPSWERMRRYEAYPEIKARSGVPGLPRFALLVGALAVAAIALFMLPALLGFGGGGSASPSPSASAPRASASVGPTVKPEPTPLLYTIKQGDNLLKVAKKFNVTLEDLLAANKDTITNPDKIAIGDTIIIPTPAPGGSAPASKAPAASASP